MKICWDNLEKYKVKYNIKNDTFRYWSGTQWKTIYYWKECENCKESFLSGKNQRFCSQSCSNSVSMKIRMSNPEKKKEILEKTKQGRVEKIGVDVPAKDPNIARKIKETNNNKTNEEKKLIKEKKKQTNLKIRGVDVPAKDFRVLNKIKQTNLKNRNVEWVFQDKEVQKKCLNTAKKNYNYEHDESIINVYQIKEIKEKCKKTKFERHGDENFNNRKQAEETVLINYGVKHPFQNSEFYENIFGNYKNSWHDYQLPSGKWIKLQGYEPQALDELLEVYKEEEFLYKKSKVPEIWYRWNDNTWHRYYPDFYIPKENLVIEVKSTYTYKKDLEINILKEEATKYLGYNFKLIK